MHNYSDEEALGMLRALAEAMAPDSRLLIVNLLMADPPTRWGRLMDMFMLNASGKERSLEDLGGRC